MRIDRILEERKLSFSFEFFPPKTPEGFAQLFETVARLKGLSPAFVSVTYGAGGSTRQKTLDLVARLKHELGLEAMAHLTCVGHTRSELLKILEALHKEGVENVLALRGDPLQGMPSFEKTPGGFAHAIELVQLIRKEKFSFCVGVAAYPEGHKEAKDREEDLLFLKEKVDAGADFCITQLFFQNRDFFSFLKRARELGIRCPVVPGIMPILNFAQIKRFTELCGATIPQELSEKLALVQEDREKVEAVGVAHALEQCRELADDPRVPGIHFYTLNRSSATANIVRALKA